MALSFSLVKEGVSLGLEAAGPRVRDMFEVSGVIKAIFSCPNRGFSVNAVLSGPLSVSASSSWKGYFSGLPQLFNVLDGGNQILFGRTLQQPWMGRKYWTGTEPMQFRIPLQFVSDTDARNEVYEPAMKLLSFLFPRSSGRTSDGEGDEAQILAEYIVPGPSLFYNENSERDKGLMGDYVVVSVGRMLHFRACYIESVSLNVENSYDLKGFPHCIKADVTFRAMDSMIVPGDADFKGLIGTSFATNEVLEKLTQSATGLAEKAKSYAGKFFTKSTEFVTDMVSRMEGG